METLKKLFSNIVFTSALLLVLGGLLLFAPSETLQTYVRVIGVVLLAGAVLGLLLEFVIKQSPRSLWAVVGACAAAVLGLVFLLAPSFVTAILPFLFGVVLIVLSAFELLSALQLPFGSFQAKKCTWGAVTRCYPEYESVAELAKKNQMPFTELFSLIRDLAQESSENDLIMI